MPLIRDTPAGELSPYLEQRRDNPVCRNGGAHLGPFPSAPASTGDHPPTAGGDDAVHRYTPAPLARRPIEPPGLRWHSCPGSGVRRAPRERKVPMP